jgi:hypothetical protein
MEDDKTRHPADCVGPGLAPTMSAMAAVIEVPQLDSWFLIDWPDAGRPSVLMEFETKAEADTALRAAIADVSREDRFGVGLAVRSGLAMLADPDLRDALTAWDLEFSEI